MTTDTIVFFFQAEDGIRDSSVTGVQTCALPICESALHFCSRQLQHKHRQKDSQQPSRRSQDALAAARQNAEASINELDVHPVNQQRSVTKLDERTKSALSQTPSAPGVCEYHEQQQHAEANHEKVRASMPEIVHTIDMPRP